MEINFGYAVVTAIWLGILTSISPCPMATNVAAISFLSKSITSRKAIILSGLVYMLGRTIAYIMLSIIISMSLASIPDVARFFQKIINYSIGPLLILVGIAMFDVFKLSFAFNNKLITKTQTTAEKGGYLGAITMGLVFALSFCPVSAGIFFGSLIPLAMKSNSVLVSFSYGLGTALPVVVIAFILAFSTQFIGNFYKKVQQIEWWAQRITGLVFILIGIYLTYKYVLLKLLIQ